MGYTIYGVYKEKATADILITNKANGGQMIGVYQGEAGNITINNTGGFGCIYGVQESTVNGTLTLTNTDAVRLSTCFAAYDSTVKDIVLTNTSTAVSSYLMAANTCTVAGDVTVTVAGDNGLTVSNLYGLLNSQTTGKFRYIQTGGNVSNLQGVFGGIITSSDALNPVVKADFSNDAKVGGAYIVQDASVTAKGTTAVDVDVTCAAINGAFYGVYAGTDKEAVVRGNIDLNFELSELPSTSTGMVSAAYTSGGDVTVYGDVIGNFTKANIGSPYLNYGAEVNGKVDMDVVQCKFSYAYANYYGVVHGKLTIDSDKDTYMNGCYFSYGGLVKSDVEVNLYGLDREQYPSNYFYLNGVYGYYTKDENNKYAVEGNVTVNLLGGDFNSFQSVYSAPIAGDVTIKLKDVSNYSGSSSNVIGSASIDGNVSVKTEGKCYFKSSIYGVVNGGRVGGNVTIDFVNFYEETGSSNYSYFEGVYGVVVEGNVDVHVKGGSWGLVYGVYYSNSSTIIKGDCTVLLEDIQLTSSNTTYGIYGGSGAVGGDVNVTVKNISGLGNSEYYLYAVDYVNAIEGYGGKEFNVTLDNVKGAYSVYAIYNSGCGIYRDVVVDVNDVSAKNCFYGIYSANIMGTTKVDIEDTDAYYWYGAYDANCVNESLTVNIKDCNSLTSGSSTGYTYLVYGGSTRAPKGIDINVENCNFVGVNSVNASLVGDIDLEINGGSYAFYGGVFNTYSVTDYDGKKVKGTISNATLSTTSSDGSWYLSNNVNGDNDLDLTIDDKCKLPDNYTVYTNTNGAAVVRLKDEIYFSGDYEITEADLASASKVGFSYYKAELPSLSKKYIEFMYTELVIPKGVTVKATEGFKFAGGTIVLAGTLDGPCAEDDYNKNFSASARTKFCMNGGKIANEALDTLTAPDKWYPVDIDYNKAEMTISSSSVIAPTSDADLRFARTATSPSLNCNPKKGFTLEGGTATFQAEGEAATDMAKTTSGTNVVYSFDMVSKPAKIKITSGGIPIQLGKTVADPVALLNTQYVMASPLYDFKSLVVYNDSEEGEMSYKLSSGQTLPEGLTLNSVTGIITGKPTALYEKGKKVTFTITGKNKTTAEITLNMIVTSDADKEQTSQDGRILVDDKAKTVNSLGTSVVLRSCELEGGKTGTAVYLDENMDGTPDKETPVVSGDYSAYSFYGVSGIEVKKPIRITMDGGTFANVYGVANGKVTTEGKGDAVFLDIKDGSITTCLYGASSSTVSEGVHVELAKSTIAKTVNIAPSSTCQYALLNNGGAASLSGVYTLKNDMTVTSFTVNAGTYSKMNELTINSGATLKATTMSAQNYTRIYNRGTVDITNYNATSSSRQLVIGDAKVLPETNSFAYLYYPVKVTYENLPASSTDDVKVPYIDSGYTVLYEDVMYAPSKASNQYVYLYYTSLPGYRAYYSLNGGEDLALDTTSNTYGVSQTSRAVYCENKATTVRVTYVAQELEPTVKIGAPTAAKGKEYTAEAPLYDYSTVLLVNDAKPGYGSAPVYRLKKGSSLPAGLSLDANTGKVTGTPTTLTSADGVLVEVQITGRNGSQADVALKYTVAETENEKTDINEALTYNGYSLDLNGHSVVIYEDPQNSSYCNVYLDENHDGVADVDEPFTYTSGKTTTKALNLSTVYGYRNTETPLEGDLTIYLHSGPVSSLYGVYGVSATEPAKVKGKVSVYQQNARVSSRLYAGYYASAEELNLYCTGGSVTSYAVAAYCPVDVKKVNFSFTDKATYYGYSNSSYNLCATQMGTVSGDVSVVIGGSGTNHCFSSNYGRFRGVYSTKVTGDVNYEVVGNWRPGYENNFANSATIDGDLNVNWKKGYITTYNSNDVYRALVNNSTVQDINIVADAGLDAGSVSYLYPYYGGSIQNVYMNVPQTVSSSVYTSLKHPSDDALPENGGFVFCKGSLYLSGDYTIDESMTLSSLVLYDGADVKVDKDVTVNVSSYTTLAGKLTNKGTLSFASQLTIAAGSELINEGTLTTNYYTYVNGKATNKGTWNQTKSNIYLGTNNASVVNEGDWTTAGYVQISSGIADASIKNSGNWTSNGVVNLYGTNATLENSGDWTSNANVVENVNTVKITNSGNWNMNAYFTNYGTFVNEQSGIYKGMKSGYCTYVQNGSKVINKGTWTGIAFLYLYPTSEFDNFGYMDIDTPANAGSSYIYMQGNSTGVPKLINEAGATCNLNGRVSQYTNTYKGIIYNYGNLKQTFNNESYCYDLGVVYMARPITLAKDDIIKYNIYTKFYYPATVSYPKTAITGVSLPSAVESGITGDTRKYLQGGQEFVVAVDGYQSSFTPNVDVVKVLYTDDEDKEVEAKAAGVENQWKGTMPQKTLEIQVNVEKSGAQQITIAPASITIDQLTVDLNNTKIYDLSSIVISKDDESAEGAVTYAVSATKPLPEGLTLSDKGVISGAPKYASDTPYTSEIIITGKNLTRAKFTITFKKINKAVPDLKLPTGLYGYTHYTLARVRGLGSYDTGTFSWPDDTLEITDKCVAGEKFDIYFKPKDTDNYDWSKISDAIGVWDADAGHVVCQVPITMYTISPSYKRPDYDENNEYKPIDAIYGQTLADVELPKDVTIEGDEKGSWVWRNPETSVGVVGEHGFYANFVPDNQKKYSTVYSVWLYVKVAKKEVTVEKPNNLRTFKGYTISQVELPVVDYGTYKWVTASTTEVEENVEYKLVFIPKEDSNIVYTGGEGTTYSQAYKGYVMDVTVSVVYHEVGVHTFEARHDDTYHWEECICGETRNKEAHIMETATKVDGDWHITVCANENCDYEVKSRHNYVSKKDEINHFNECTGCGDKIDVAKHYYYLSRYDEESHWSECSCGAKTGVGTHDYDDTWWNYNSASHWRQCSCGARKESADHNFTELKTNGYYHWYKCEVCDATTARNSHVYGDWAECSDDETMHERSCTCGYKQREEHAYGACSSVDATKHTKTCVDCKKTVTAEHLLGSPVVTLAPTDFTDGKREQRCAECNYCIVEVLKAFIPHKYEKGYKEYDETEHWIVCDYSKDELPDGKTDPCHHEYDKENTREPHTFGGWLVDEATGTHYKQCTDEKCGYKAQIGKHTWLTESGGEEGHYQHCIVCDTKTETVAHEYTAVNDGEYHWQECACGRQINKGKHSIGGYGSDETHHWNVCSAEFCDEKSNKERHSYGAWKCSEDDEDTHYRECKCGHKQYASHAERSEFIWADTNDGSHAGVCPDCKKEVVVEEHIWDDGVVTREPTFAMKGTKLYTCTVCGGTKVVTISTLHEHDYTDAAWEYDDENHWKVCMDETCDEKDAETMGAHAFGKWVTNGKLTHRKTCECGYFISEDHTWDEGKVTREPTTTKTGIRTYTCAVCGGTKVETISKLTPEPVPVHEHDYTDAAWEFDDTYHWKSCVDETCGEMDKSTKARHKLSDWTADGETQHKRVCECGYEITRKHSFDKGVTVEPTETEDGETVYTCKDCGFIKTEVIPKLEHTHDYGEWMEHDEKTHIRVCDCGHEDIQDHEWVDGVCSVCGADEATEPETGETFEDAEHSASFVVADPTDVGIEDDDADVVIVYKGCTDETAEEVVIPDSVTYKNTEYKVVAVDASAFKGNTKITSITIGSNVRVISTSAFEGCTSLSTVTFKGSALEVIGKKAFYKCTSLTQIEIPKSVVTIKDSAFNGCKKLKTVTFQSGSVLKTLGAQAFYGCTALKTITLPSKVKTIGKGAFYKCTALTKVTISKSVTEIGDTAFSGCKKLATVTFKSGSKLKTIGAKAFYGCTALKKIALPKNLEKIGGSTFYKCKNLSQITIQSTKLKKVDKNAFKGIKSNAKIKVPSSKLAAYKKLLKNKGQGKKVAITK